MICAPSDQPIQTGRHLLVDFYGGERLDALDPLRIACEDAAHAMGAVIHDSRFHHFGDQFGITGLMLLADGHLSIHTWPEFEVTSIDIFTDGGLDPLLALPALTAYFNPISTRRWLYQRGVRDQDIVAVV